MLLLVMRLWFMRLNHDTSQHESVSKKVRQLAEKRIQGRKNDHILVRRLLVQNEPSQVLSVTFLVFLDQTSMSIRCFLHFLRVSALLKL